MSNGFSDEEIVSALQVLNTLPDYFCWKGLDLRYAMMNNATAKLFGFENSNVSFNKISDHQLNCDAANLAAEFQCDDNYVLNTGKDLHILNFCQYENNDWRLLFGQKSLVYGDNNEKKGVYGRFLDVTNCPLFKIAFGIGELNRHQVTYIVKDRFDDFNLSERESEIVFHLIRGRSAKETALLVNLSVRTVEKHLDRIKHKMNCHSRSQLIDKAWSHGLKSYLPSSLFGSALNS